MYKYELLKCIFPESDNRLHYLFHFISFTYEIDYNYSRVIDYI